MTKIIEKEYYTNEYLKKLDLDPKTKYIPLTYDPMFKKVFGNNKEILKRFLIKVLHLDIKESDCKIIIGVNELPKEQDKNYGSRVDINIIINDKIRVNLEVNQEAFKDIADRNFLFATKVHTLNVEKSTKYKDFHKYQTIQLNLNTHHYGTEVNGEDIFYIKSENTGNRIVNNFQIIIKDLAYFHDLYYTNNGKCEEDQIWLAMLISENFTELESFLRLLLDKEEKEHFLKEVINMCQNEFFVHEWEPEAMKQIVEGRKAYNREQERIEDQKRKQEIKEYEERVLKKTQELEQLKKETMQLKKETMQLKKETMQLKKETMQREKETMQREKETMQREKETMQREKETEQLLTQKELIEEQVQEETIINTIKSMLKNNLDLKIISEVTSKSIEEIEEIEKSMKD